MYRKQKNRQIHCLVQKSRKEEEEELNTKHNEHKAPNNSSPQHTQHMSIHQQHKGIKQSNAPYCNLTTPSLPKTKVPQKHNEYPFTYNHKVNSKHNST